MNQIMCKGFKVAEHPLLPEGCGMLWTEKQTIIFKVINGKFEFWEQPKWQPYSSEILVEKDEIEIHTEKTRPISFFSTDTFTKEFTSIDNKEKETKLYYRQKTGSVYAMIPAKDQPDDGVALIWMGSKL